MPCASCERGSTPVSERYPAKTRMGRQFGLRHSAQPELPAHPGLRGVPLRRRRDAKPHPPVSTSSFQNGADTATRSIERSMI